MLFSGVSLVVPANVNESPTAGDDPVQFALLLQLLLEPDPVQVSVAAPACAEVTNTMHYTVARTALCETAMPRFVIARR
jgi:hypothetical protein